MRARVSVRTVQSWFLRSSRPAAIVAAVLGLSLSIAGRAQAEPANGDKPAGGPAITQREAEEFGEALEAATIAGDFAKISELVDWEAIIDRATQTPNVPEVQAFRASFKNEIVQSAQKSGSIFGPIHDVVKSGGSVAFLRADVKGKEPFVQLRLQGANDGSLNYLRLYLVRRPNGRVVAFDLFSLVTGERMSETLSRVWLQLAIKSIRENAKTKNESSALDEEVAINLKIAELNGQGKYQEVLDEYKKAPEACRRNKLNLFCGIQAARNVSADEYSAITAAFRRYYPDHPSLDFILTDDYILKEKFDEALACLDRTIQHLGADATLLSKRANILLFDDKFPQALAEIRKAITLEPDAFEAYSAGVDISIVVQNHAATLEFLTALEKKFGLEFIDLAGSGRFAMFVKSPQFKTWQAAHGVK
jgi:tetratricopeptide (TPR) repeat protein